MFSITSISKSYQKKPVLTDVSLELAPGKCIGILGSNGSGKSTLLQILAGVIKADTGAFLVDGKDLLKKRSALPAAVGYVPQQEALMEELTGEDNLRLWYSRDEIRADLSSENGVLSLLGVAPFLKKPVRKMSGGMKKRISIACAVLSRPRLLLLDEPSAGLDIPCKEQIYRYYRGYVNAGGTILLVTHDLQEMQLCDETYILKGGRLVPYRYDGNFTALAGELS